MTPELTVLALAALLQVVQFALYAVPANLELGTGYTMSARDREPATGLSSGTARLGRALGNHFEALILFAIAVVLVTLGDGASAFTAACAWVYLGARAVYIPAYYFGWVPWRSIVWGVGFVATVAMISVTLL